MWLLLQSLVIFAVVASNIHWHWTPNGYLAGILGWIAALLLTVAVNGLADILGRRRLPASDLNAPVNSPDSLRGILRS
jgi:hypothetical protein